MGHITVSGFLIAKTLAEADRASELLAEHIRLSRAEPGCLTFDVVRSQSDPTRFALFEVFRDRPAFDAHRARTQASAWWEGTRTLERQFTIEEA
jgi:quinol monooxygenase YgiN